MAVQMGMKVDTAALMAELTKNGTRWARAVDATLSDMRRRGPTQVAKISAGQYNIAQAKLNPTNKTAHGSVSLEGGISELQFVYTGGPTPVKDFKRPLKPSSKARNRSPYTITVRYSASRASTIGHWAPPGSEGGAYSAKSPRMYIPGVSAYGPVQRVGGGWGGGNFGPSVPQMISNEGDGSRGSGEPEVKALSELMEKRLAHNLYRAGLS